MVKTAVESPLAIALVIAATLAAILRRLITARTGGPVRSRMAAEDALFRKRFEDHAKRVHDMAGTISYVKMLADRVLVLEQKMDEHLSEYMASAREHAELRGLVAATKERAETFASRFDRIERTLDSIHAVLMTPRTARTRAEDLNQ